MNTHTVKFTRSLAEDAEAVPSLPRLVCPTNRHRFITQLRTEFEDCTTHGIGDSSSAFRGLSLSWGSMEKDGDTYTVLAAIESRLTVSRLCSALQGLFDRGMAGEFEITTN
jgi:hypothetical protein